MDDARDDVAAGLSSQGGGHPGQGEVARNGRSNERRAFLFLVNPRLHYDPYPDWRVWMPRVDAGQRYATQWNTGARRSGMAQGDVALLVKVGQAPRGLVAIGEVTSEIYEGPHWNPEALSPVTGWVHLSFDHLFDLDDPVPLEILRAIGPSVRWTPRMSGTEVPIEVAREILAFVDPPSSPTQ